MNEDREKLQDIIRQVVVLNTDAGEAIKGFESRFKQLQENITALYEEIDEKIENL